MPPSLRRRRLRAAAALGAALGAALAALVIALLTLTPQPNPEGIQLPFWCLVCGTLGGADVIGNVLLFMPLGAMLALAGLPVRRVVLLGALASGAIELTQAIAVPGRFSTVSDVVTNTLGALLGALVATQWRTLVAPRDRASLRLALGAAVAWNVVTALGAWALERDPAGGPVPPIARAGVPIWGSGWFHGHVRHGDVDGVATQGDRDGPVVVRGRTGQSIRLAADVVGRDERRQPVAFLAALDGDGRVQATLAQRDSAASISVRLRASRARLRRQSLRLPGPFAPAADSAPLRVVGSYADHTLALAAERGGRHWERAIRLAPSMAWMLIVPFLRFDAPWAGHYTAGWLLLLTAPMGYWSAWLGARPWGEGRRRPLLAAAIVVLAAVGALAVTPTLGTYGVERAAVWGWATAGALAGAALAVAAAWGAHFLHKGGATKLGAPPGSGRGRA